MSQSSRQLRQGLWQPRFSIRHDCVITVAELNSLRQRLQSVDRILNNIADTLQKVRLRPVLSSNQCTEEPAQFEVLAERLHSARAQLAARLQRISARRTLNHHADVFPEMKRLVEEVDTVLDGCCRELTQQ